MESSSDSSIWRSLAVAFGDGLAFGVGMKLSQNAARKSARPAAPVLDPLATRLEQVEQRLERMERAPALLAAASTATGSAARPGSGAGAFDQKVIEAVVNALEARLKEHSGQVERCLTDLEAKIAIELQSLHQQDQSIASGTESRLDEVRQQLGERASAAQERLERDIASLRAEVVSVNREFAEAVSHIVDQRVAGSVKDQADALEQTLDRKLAAAAQAVEERLAGAVREQTGGLDRQITSAAETRLSAMEQHVSAAVEVQLGAIEQQVSAAVAAHFELLDRQVAATVDARAAAIEGVIANALRSEFHSLEKELRAAMDRKDREIAELRERLADSDRAAMDFVAAVGDLCRRSVDRIVKPSAPPSNAARQSVVPPPAEPAPETACAPPPAPEAALDAVPEPAPAPEAALELVPESAPPPPPPAVQLAPEELAIPMAAAAPQTPVGDFDALPGFAQPKAARSWHLPVVSSLLALAGVLLLRYW